MLHLLLSFLELAELKGRAEQLSSEIQARLQQLQAIVQAIGIDPEQL